MAPTAVLGGSWTAERSWRLIACILVFALPMIRMLGKTGEHHDPVSIPARMHDPERTREMDVSVFGGTVKNIGPIHPRIVPPFGDGDHTLPPTFSAVPGLRIGHRHPHLKNAVKTAFRAGGPHHDIVSQARSVGREDAHTSDGRDSMNTSAQP